LAEHPVLEDRPPILLTPRDTVIPPGFQRQAAHPQSGGEVAALEVDEGGRNEMLSAAGLCATAWTARPGRADRLFRPRRGGGTLEA
jgi:hypothetical protein